MEHDDFRWVEGEFLSLALGDARLDRRFRQLAGAASRQPHGRINRVFESVAEKEAAYRFVENRRVTPDKIIGSSADASMRRAEGNDLLVVLDQTSLSFQDPQDIRGLGRIGADSRRKTARGIEVMTALCLEEKRGLNLGLVGQEWFVRGEKSPKQRDDRRSPLDKESIWWIKIQSSATTNIRRTNPHARITFVADRGADSFRFFGAATRLGADFIVRAAYDRCLVSGGLMSAALYATPLLGRLKRSIRVKNGDVVTERQVKLDVRAARVSLTFRTPQHERRGELEVTAVRIADRRKHGVRWTLLTTWPVETLEDAARVVDAYCRRWKIEDFHRAWKKGCCNVEASQLRSVGAITIWATLLAVVAARVERLKELSRKEPALPARDELSEDEIEALSLISRERKHWPKDWSQITIGEAANLIAYLGGWGGRSQGPAGSTILGRGLERLEFAAVVVRAVHDAEPKK